MQKAVAIAYLDGNRLSTALSAGIRHVFQRRDYINRINVFPVPDGDTGTNMAFTFKAILDAIGGRRDLSLQQVVHSITEGALDGARGNSGAIMAQFFHGFGEALEGKKLLTAACLANASNCGAQQAWTAMSEPVPGTLPTVLEDFATRLTESVAEGVHDIRTLLELGLERARESLANTPNLLPALKQAGVVDAGGQGFVDLLEGIWAFTDHGEIDALDAGMTDLDPISAAFETEVGEHHFCTECVIEGQGMDRFQIMSRLQELDCSSLMVAGSERRIRVHIHVNNPGEVFLACEAFGEIRQQKADDMRRQHGLLNHPGQVAVVVDSGGDLPDSEVERLGIHVVPVRLSFGDREYLDGVSMKPEQFYRMLDECDEFPQTSQPPAADFRRVYSLLGSHGYEVISIGLSSELSGTTQAARSAAERTESAKVRVFDTLNVSSGQGLLAIVAAEAAAAGKSVEEIGAMLDELIPQTQTIAIPDELTSAVRGGRVPAWLQKVTRFFRIMPVLCAKEGKLGLAGVKPGRGFSAKSLAGYVLRNMKKDRVYRVMISHAANDAGAHEVRRIILERHPMIHSCHIAEAGPALGAHLGRGGLIVGFLPQPGS